MKNIIVWDLESCTWNFKADKGFLLCVGYKFLGEPKIHILERKFPHRDIFDDKDLCKQAYEVLADPSVEGYIGHNLNFFDVPFLNTRLLLNGLPVLPRVKIFDTCNVMYKKLRMGNSLKNAIFQFKLPSEKTSLDLPGSLRAAAGDKKEMRLITDHCVKDVQATEELYKRVAPLGAPGWSIGALSKKPDACPSCGSAKLQRRGWNVALKRRSPRLQCQDCGAWSSGKTEVIPNGD